MWQFFWYSDPAVPVPWNPWKDWYDDQDGQVRARHDVVFGFLETRPNWTKPYAKKLDEGLVEITLKARVQHRLIGFDWPQRSCFTILLACTHKGQVYNPKDALETARRRMTELRGGRIWIRRCVRPK
jgi:hypothetical protein